ncbi:c5f03966-97b1-4f2a-8e3a-7a68283611d1 [Sclerotinia trifoliorum]|uniref:C5f03966-97b1-4f2a-8e3a-7a68283611d1 n=1 Tax=Sclerotinia trifoliorum TaxID=28548 RepID=A0A8H2VSM3_9HELO|nr:c5f03966-97b1-4f2a-8e3a-7a68283611d1 [Sclerotinia trifoliorum]
MSTRSESQKQAAETAPAIRRAKGKAATDNAPEVPGNAHSSGRRWTQEEKDSVLVQICLQAGGKSFTPKWEDINVPGRSEKALQHFWSDIKKPAADSLVHAAELKDGGDSNDKKGRKAADEAGEGAIQKKPKVAKKAAAKAKAKKVKDDTEEKLPVDEYFDTDA